MLPHLNRLTGKKNFEKVADEGEIFQSENFGVAYVKRQDKNPSRYAFVVSTKISKEATERNRVKRIMREAVRQSLFEVKPCFDVAFLAKQSIMRTPTSVIAKEVRKALKDAGLSK
jgi:ribonuclease P protein component